MHVVAVIPARYGSTRLPGKPLKLIGDKPMIWWVNHRLKEIKKIDDIYVATDDARISETCRNYDINCIMTSSKHLTAANRMKEVSDQIKADFYLQINGDEPLIDVSAVEAAILEEIPVDIEFGTNIITQIKEPAHVLDPSNIKVVFDDKYRALYMSRTPIPFPFKSIEHKYYKHVGIIGYNKKMLDFYANSEPGRFERIEGIDTLRFLDYGKTLQFVMTDACESLSVDTEKDLEAVRRLLFPEVKNAFRQKDDIKV